MKYGIVMDNGKYENCVVRFYKSGSEVFKNGRWEDFWILSPGADDPYDITPISEEEAEMELGKNLRMREKEFIDRINEAERSIEGKSTEELIRLAQKAL